MWQFITGFVLGAYVNQKYKLPNLEFWIDKLKKEEEKRRK